MNLDSTLILMSLLLLCVLWTLAEARAAREGRRTPAAVRRYMLVRVVVFSFCFVSSLPPVRRSYPFLLHLAVLAALYCGWTDVWPAIRKQLVLESSATETRPPEEPRQDR